LTQYCQVSEVYREPLSATSLSIATTLDHNKVAIKKIYKEDLITGFQKRQAIQEFPLHCSLNHSNIVKGLEWSENDNEYVMVMEYMNNATYFQEKIDRVIIWPHLKFTTIEPDSSQERNQNEIIHY